MKKENDKNCLVSQSTFEKTKAILDEMYSNQKKKTAVADIPGVTQIFKDLQDKKNSYKRWKQF